MWNSRIVVALVLSVLGASAACAAEARDASPDQETAKQRAIFYSRGKSKPWGYITDRSLLTYVGVLPPEFRVSLADLRYTDRWLDIGAGEGNAILDYCTVNHAGILLPGLKPRVRKAKAVAISIEDRRTERWYRSAGVLGRDHIRYLFGRSLREYSPAKLGRFRLITDVSGGFSYTRNLSQFTKISLDLLELNGSFYTLLQDVLGERGTNAPLTANRRFKTEIADADGAAVSVCSWLKRISCVAVTCDLKLEWGRPHEAYGIRKVCRNVNVPDLTPVHFRAGTPPERRYRLAARDAPSRGGR